MKILMPVLMWENASFKLGDGTILGGVERFQNLVYENIDGIIPVYIAYHERTRNRVIKKLQAAAEEHSANAIFWNTARGYSVASLDLGLPVVMLNHDPGDRGNPAMARYTNLRSFVDGGGKLFCVSADQHRKSDVQSMRMNGHTIGDVQGYIPSAFASGDEQVSEEVLYDAITIGRTEEGKHPFWLHAKLKSSPLTSCVLTRNALTEKQMRYGNKHQHWTAPRFTFRDLNHADTMKALSAGSVYVSTCPYESWGITALEALAHGLPLVLVTDGSGTHASQNVAAADSDYALISKSIKLREFEELLERYRALNHSDRLAISDRTKAKHSKANWISAIRNMLDLHGDGTNTPNVEKQADIRFTKRITAKEVGASENNLMSNKTDLGGENMTEDANVYRIPSGKRIALTDDLASEIKSRFQQDRDNRFQIYLIAAGLRKKHLTANAKGKDTYDKAFRQFYRANDFEKLFGKLDSQFGKYAASGEVIAYVSKGKYFDKDRPDFLPAPDVSPFLNALPLSINALYQIWFIIKDDEIDDTTFRTLFKTTPKRTDVGQSLKDAKTPDVPLIHPHATAAELMLWRKNWLAPPERKLPRGDKRTLLLAAVTVSGELFDFKLGGHAGCVNLDEVRDAIERLEVAIEKLNKGAEKFLVLSNETYLSEGYTRREEHSQWNSIIEVKAKKRAEAKALREKIAKAKAKGIKVRKPKPKPVNYKKLQALDLSKITGFIK